MYYRSLTTGGEMLKTNTNKESLESFGKTLTIVLFLLSAYWRHRGHSNVSQNLLYAAFFFSFVSLFIPTYIKYLYLAWMKLANFIATIITTTILFIVYYILVTPYSLLIKVFRGDMLNKKIESEKDTYWVNRKEESADSKKYRRQY
ncbi:hypothetical protein ACFL1F_01250 [Chlamydiota bacterium]